MRQRRSLYSSRPHSSDRISDPGAACVARAGRQFQRLDRAEDDRRQSPGPECAIDMNDDAAAIHEDDVDRKPHEEHMHPQKRLEATAYDEQSFARLQSIAPYQSSASGEMARGFFKPR